MMRKLFAAMLALALCLVTLSGIATVATATNVVQPEYKIEVNGSKGTVTRTNNTTVIYDDMYIRYSITCMINGEPYMMIDLIDVKWDEAKDGISGTFSIPKLQTTGKISNEFYMLTTDETANQKPITDVIPNAYGVLIP